MQYFWTDGALFVKDLVEKYPDPKPHFPTHLSTYVKMDIGGKGFLTMKAGAHPFFTSRYSCK